MKVYGDTVIEVSPDSKVRQDQSVAMFFLSVLICPLPWQRILRLIDGLSNYSRLCVSFLVIDYCVILLNIYDAAY